LVTVALLGGVLVEVRAGSNGVWLFNPVRDQCGHRFSGVYLLRVTPDSPMAAAEKTTNPLALLVAPLREVNFRCLIVFLSSWNFAANLAAPFFTVYMLK
jgi:hypothetical protein